MIRAIVYLREELGLRETLAGSTRDVGARVELVSTMKASAIRSQAALRSFLDEERGAGRVVQYRPFWITNAIAIEAEPSVVRALATHSSVGAVGLDHWRHWVTASSSESERRTSVRDHGQRETGLVSETTTVEWNVSRVRADEVWHSLLISGTGAVVAGLDTGVDWLHPALQSSYRGYNPHGPTDHRYSWYDATGEGTLYPVDGHGHGSHTLGTGVGEGGIGVAPGAQWIGVKVLNNQGYGYDSWIHAGLQWVLAPGGDPTRAPDVVNCSWGNRNSYLLTFQEDLRALCAAGILPVFSNGNEGPDPGSVGSPASLPEAFAVGAVDEGDVVANFSSRGPSPWGEIRPHVAAPGVHVRSSTPGGAYQEMDGTSMAAPHASGAAALLRSISPTLSITRVAHAITSTAVPLGDDVPNNDTGWGRIDAFAAATAVARPGYISGTVGHGPGPDPQLWHPIAGARASAVSRGVGQGSDITDDGGVYSLALAPGTYDLTASAFGYQPKTVWGVGVETDTTTVQDVNLTPVPTGTLHVLVTDLSANEPLSATVGVLETPYETTSESVVFDLPAGSYTVQARRLGRRVVTATAGITVGQVTEVVLSLPEAPSVLLVDSGRWYYESQIGYFRQALEDLRYAFDEFSILDLWRDVPSASDLLPYDLVVWSAPRDAPGYIGAGSAVGEYLEAGGRLILTGQDVGFWDGGGALGYWSSYYRDYLKARFIDDEAPTRRLTGESGDIFAGQTITIAGPGGADNQDFPDVIGVADVDAAAPILRYDGDGCGGIRVGTCLDYRAVYLPFGFEAINERDARRELMRRAIDWLAAPVPVAGLELRPPAQLGIGSPGSTVTHAVRLRHLGQAGSADTVTLTLHGASWPTEISAPSVTLSPCASTTVSISVTIPATASLDMRDVVIVEARSSLSPTVSAGATMETKTPAPVLLVDDDRWYDQQETYTRAMDEAGLVYDVWETARVGGGHVSGPTAETLQQYPVTVWWTGYDWYAPVTEDEEDALEAYLDAGGRLMLSSQDFLYYHHQEPFSRRYLGVLTYTEDVTPTHVEGVPENLVGSDLGPWPLSYPQGYQNWSDAVVPNLDVGVAFRDQNERGAALTRREGEGATLFMPFPFEALPADQMELAMERSIGWLSWLGRSTFEVEPRSPGPGDVVTYTIAVRNDGPAKVTAALSNPLPADLDADPGSFVGPGTYDPAADRLSWRGEVTPGETVTFGYAAGVPADASAGDSIVNAARVLLEDHSIAVERSARLRISTPDLSRSSFGCVPPVLRPGSTTTCTLVLDNAGAADAEPATARVHPPGELGVGDEVLWTSNGLAREADGSLIWSGPLMAGGTATLTFPLQAPAEPVGRTRHGVAFLSDGAGGRWERAAWVVVEPWSGYLPVVTRSN
jgi:uncharacterized repeat protein (TIGR01451 family)